MEQITNRLEIEARRKKVAAYIQDSLQPAKHLLEEGLLDDVDEDITTEAQDFEVREYQLDAWSELWEARQRGEKHGLIHLATGLGKTSVGVFDVVKYRDEYDGRRTRGPRILFASHKNEINTQAADRFKTFIPDASQGFYNGEEKAKDADITFATLQSLFSNLGSFKPSYFDYIIYDEAHHGKADTFEEVIKYFRPKFELALTATPNRPDGLKITELFGEALYSKGLATALAEGLLADPDYHIVFDDAVKEAMQSGFETNTLVALNELFDVKPRNEVITRNIKDEMERIGLEFGAVKTIVFCQNIEHATEIAELLGGKPYHSALNKGQKRKTLEEFKNGDLQVITTRDMFNEGVDIPDARLLVFLRSTSSQTVFEQQLGRGLRKHSGKDRVSVLDFVANVERIAMIRQLAEEVKSLKPVKQRKTREGINEKRSEGVFIHTNHGDFDFDQMSVDLLTRYESMKMPDAPLADENLFSFNSAYEIYGVSTKVLERLVNKEGWELPYYRFGPQTTKAISSHQIERLRELYPKYFAQKASDDENSINGVADILNVDHYTVKRIVDQNRLKLPYRKFGGVVTVAIGTKELEIIKNNLERGSKPSSLVISVPTLANELGGAPATVRRLAREYNLELGIYRFGKGRTEGEGITSEQADVLRSNVTPKLAENELTPKEACAQLHIHYQTLVKIVDELGLVLPRRTRNGRPSLGVTPEIYNSVLGSDYYSEIINNDRAALRRRKKNSR